MLCQLATIVLPGGMHRSAPMVHTQSDLDTMADTLLASEGWV
jgi:hypothetical protein